MRYTVWKTLPILPSDTLARSLMVARGLSESDDELHDPFLLPDMQKATVRINKALADGEMIAVYGDYDVDGITATCLLTDYLRSRGAECVYYIPNRIEMGYGLHATALEQLYSQGVTLVVSVDVGVTAFDAAKSAANIGLDLVITDHHTCRAYLPEAVAIVNPKREDNEYPFVGLAGVGVAFKLICALEGTFENLLERYSDLVALGTVADIVPLMGENRYITKRGLKNLSKRPGIAALLAIQGKDDKPITSSTIAFGIAPLLNAAGRMKSAELALELLLTDDIERTRYLAMQLATLNEQRKEIETEMFAQALEMYADGGDSAPAIVLTHESWHPGVTGILASKLLERYKKPVFLITQEGDCAKGTARCPKHLDLIDLMERCSDTLLAFGGHSAAAGFTIEVSKIGEFAAAMQNAVAAVKLLQPEEALVIDAIVAPREINRQNAEELAELGPFGAGNPEPVFQLNRAVIQRIIPLKEGRHLRIQVNAEGMDFTAICFGFALNGFPYRVGDTVDLAFRMGLNYFRGGVTVQMELVDIR